MPAAPAEPAPASPRGRLRGALRRFLGVQWRRAVPLSNELAASRETCDGIQEPAESEHQVVREGGFSLQHDGCRGQAVGEATGGCLTQAGPQPGR
ncbi:hypothetical protein ABZ752_32870 [Streptomyces roseifaciens]